MTTTILSYKTKNYYISLECEARTYGHVYIVEACPLIDGNRCGYPEHQMLYGMSDRKNAERTFKRYCKKYR